MKKEASSSKSKKTSAGTIRFKTKNLQPYEKTSKGWKKTKRPFEEAKLAISLFKAHHNIKYLTDKKNHSFLKGELSSDNKIKGARIDILPDGTKIDKAYSIFAKNLTIHDESSNSHWDVLYQNDGGTWAYCYTLDKKHLSEKEKYKQVESFGKIYSKLLKKAYDSIKKERDIIALAMYTLLKTYMRVGNEIYYKAHKHKGLTTMKKRDICIGKNGVTFSYLSKNGVPLNIQMQFPPAYVKRLKETLNKLEKNSFVFINEKTGHPLHDTDFKHAFKRFTGIEFYPHIVRSYYATKKAKEFLQKYKNLKPTKTQVREFFSKIAEKLGHKKFSKKDNQWKDSYTVTVHYYINPKLVEQIKTLSEQ